MEHIKKLHLDIHQIFEVSKDKDEILKNFKVYTDVWENMNDEEEDNQSQEEVKPTKKKRKTRSRPKPQRVKLDMTKPNIKSLDEQIKKWQAAQMEREDNDEDEDEDEEENEDDEDVPVPVKKQKVEQKDLLSVAHDVQANLHAEINLNRKSKHPDPKVAGIHNMIRDIHNWASLSAKDKKTKYWILIFEALWHKDNESMNKVLLEAATGIKDQKGKTAEEIISNTINGNSKEWNDRAERKWIIQDVDEDDKDVRELEKYYKIDDEIWNNKDVQKVCKKVFGERE